MERLTGSVPPELTAVLLTSPSEPSRWTRNTAMELLPWLTAKRKRPSGLAMTSLSESSGPSSPCGLARPVPPVANDPICVS